jgi:glycosyltransferase involved in cell wall biosynthesis
MKKNNKVSEQIIAYIIGTYPFMTTTFIDREIFELKEQGLKIHIVAMRKPINIIKNQRLVELAKNLHYIIPAKIIFLLNAFFYFLITQPYIFSSTVSYLVTRKHKNFRLRIKTFFHFIEGILAAMHLNKMNIKQIHAHFADRSTTVALVASRFLKVPYSFTAHANDIYVNPIMLKEKIENAKFVTTCTKYNKQYLEKIYGKKIELVYHGLDLNDFKNKKQDIIKKNQNSIISVGKLKEKKGFEYLIKACSLLKIQNIKFSCEIIGEGPENKRLLKLIEELKLHKEIKLSGALQHKKVIEKLHSATVFVLPCIQAKNYDRDGIPNVILEAMANKLPVISTNFSGIPEVINNMDNGILVETRNEKKLAKSIKKILFNHQLIQQFSYNGRKTVEQKFDIKKNILPLIELFN